MLFNLYQKLEQKNYRAQLGKYHILYYHKMLTFNMYKYQHLTNQKHKCKLHFQ